MSLYHVYLVRCADDTLYCGITTDIERRIRQHNEGKGAKYTRVSRRRPVELLTATSPMDKSSALKLEYQVKQQPRSLKLEFLVQHQKERGMERLGQAELRALRISVSEAAKFYGLKNCDVAIPVDWVRECQAQGFNPVGMVVWDYSRPGFTGFGEPFPLTVEAEQELQRLFPDREIPPCPGNAEIIEFQQTAEALLQKHYGLTLNDTELHNPKVVYECMQQGYRPFEIVNEHAESAELVRIDSPHIYGLDNSLLDAEDEDAVLAGNEDLEDCGPSPR